MNDATRPDLSAFKVAGGKLLLWRGWADEHITPLGTIAYDEAMQKVMARQTWTRSCAYLAPGVANCGSGEGLPNMDLVSAVVAWTEQGAAPDAITTYRVDTSGSVTSSRPMYPFPSVAKYNGTGDPDVAAKIRAGRRVPSSPAQRSRARHQRAGR